MRPIRIWPSTTTTRIESASVVATTRRYSEDRHRVRTRLAAPPKGMRCTASDRGHQAGPAL